MGVGWGLNNRMHFDEIVLNYDRLRPEYPKKLFSDIFDYIGTDNVKNALEIGAGTGKATVSFLDAGYNVTAVEIGTNMADFLRGRFNSYNKFKVIVAAFEDALLEDGNYDLIYAAASFHWIDAKIGCPKAFHLLNNGGTFALFRYNSIPPDGDVLYEEIQEVYKKYYHKPYKKPVRKTHEDFKEPIEILNGYGFKDLNKYGFTDISVKLYDAAKTFNADVYIDLLDTLADHRGLPEDDKVALYAGIKEAILRHGGLYKVDYIFQLYMGRKI